MSTVNLPTPGQRIEELTAERDEALRQVAELRYDMEAIAAGDTPRGLPIREFAMHSLAAIPYPGVLCESEPVATVVLNDFGHVAIEFDASELAPETPLYRKKGEWE